ncbi:MAG: thioredoxin-disulfide reductase [Synergistaceae bacterium]|jgi:thioredoxin reductase (NADPH)|nr:thioredoxin-disulfide reductase [Synergistaceae bacterium]
MEKRQLVIIGSGPAGLTAAIYGRRSGLDTLILEGGLYGGQVNNTAEITNYPGIKMTSGMDLAEAMREHAAGFGAEFLECTVGSLSLTGDDKVISTDKGDISADAVIIAAGSTNNKAGFKGEDEFSGRGVTYCAVCDGPMYQGAAVAVIGGGNTAVEEADYLTRFASKVYILHRREALRANSMAVERAKANPKIEMLLGWVPDEVTGGDMVRGLKLRSLKSGRTKEIAVEGIFVFVGAKPNVSFLDGCGVEMSAKGWIKTDDMMETSAEGVFAAGDVRDKFLRQVATAVGDGATAAMAAYDYISNQHYLKSVLFKPDRAVALLISSIDSDHLALAREADEWANSGGSPVVTIDGHHNLRIKEKLGVRELPALVEIRGGIKTREARPSSIRDIKDFCSGA